MAVWLVTGSIAASTVAHSVFLHQLVQQSYDPASPVSAATLAAVAGLALAPRLPLDERAATARIPGIALPRVLSGSGIAILGASRWTDVPPVSVGLAVAGILLALGAIQVIQNTYLGQIKATTEALRTTERRLTEAQRISHTGSVEIRLPDLQTTWSPEMARILGVDPDTPPAVETVAQAIHPDDLALAERAWFELIGQTTPFELTFRIRRPDGEVRWIRGRGSALRDPSGSIVGAAGTFLDDTDRVVADGALRAAERRFVQGFERGQIAAAIFDLTGQPTEVNQAMCDFLQRSRQELLAGSWIGFSHPREPVMADAIADRLKRGLDTYQGERRFVRPDGSVVWASGHLSLMRDDGQPDYLLAQLADISAVKQLEAEHRLDQQRRTDLLARLAQAEDLERDRIARDIHDDTIQRMAGSSMLIEAARRGLAAGRLSDDEVLERLAEAGEAVMVATERIRDVVYNLATPEVDAQIVDATRSLADWLFSGTNTRAEAPPASTAS